MRQYKSEGFHKRHYEVIVALLAEFVQENSGSTVAQAQEALLAKFSGIFSADNSRFDIQRFLDRYDQLMKGRVVIA